MGDLSERCAHDVKDAATHLDTCPRCTRSVRVAPTPANAVTVDRDILTHLMTTLRVSAYVLSRFPDQLPAQVAGRLSESSPVERRIIELLRSQTVRPWLRPAVQCFEPASGPLVNTLGPHGEDISALAVDGGTVAVSVADGRIAMWDVGTGTRTATLPGHGEKITELIFPPATRTLLAQSPSRMSRWDLETETRLTLFPDSPSGSSRVARSADCTRVVAVNAGAISMLDVMTGEVVALPDSTPATTFRQVASSSPIYSLNLSPAGSTAVLVARRVRGPRTHEMVLHIIRLSDGRWLYLSRPEWTDRRPKIAITNQILVLATMHGLCVWDLEDGTERIIKNTVQGADLNDLAVTFDGRFAVTATGIDRDNPLQGVASRDPKEVPNSVVIWNLQTERLHSILSGHANCVHRVIITPDDRHVVTVSWDLTMRVWRLEDGEEVARLVGHTAEITDVAVTSEGRQIVSASCDHTLRVWNLCDGTPLASLEGHTGVVSVVQAALNGGRVASGSADHTVRVWETDGLAASLQFDRHHGAVTAIGVSTGGNATTVVTAAKDRSLKVWELETGRCVATARAYWSTVSFIAVDPAGRWAVSNSGWNFYIWSLADGSLASFLRGAGLLLAISFDTWRALSFADDALHIVDLRAGTWTATPFDQDGLEVEVADASDDPVSLGGTDVWTLRSRETQARIYTGERLTAWRRAAAGEILIAAAGSGGVYFLHPEGIGAGCAEGPTQGGGPKLFLTHCPGCDQAVQAHPIPTPAVSVPSRWSCTACGIDLLIHPSLEAVLPHLSGEPVGERIEIVEHRYPVGFWLESTRHMGGGYYGVCRLCGGGDNDPGPPPHQCWHCHWPGT